MGLNLEYIEGQTPLEEEEKEDLLIATISTREELDEFEQQNIEQAIQWILSRSFKVENLLTEQFICQLHKRMYGNVWAWAGSFRKTNKNIGVEKHLIPIELKYLLDDTSYWISNKVFSNEEIAIRCKHRLVSIHCFANGNGRHSRVIADILIEKIFKMQHFSWGAANLVKQGESRKLYIEAVRAADKGDFSPLLIFARS